MGMVLGKITVETPPYEVITATPDYEIRKYPPYVVAQVTYTPSQPNNRDSGFMILANYIGALGNPQNTKPEKIPMTAPVITTINNSNSNSNISEKIAMTAPVVTSAGDAEEVTMQFILPCSKYKKAEEAPRPVDERVVVKEEGERKYGVVKFSGAAGEGEVKERVDKLRGWLERDGYRPVMVGGWLLARYNPPWTLPFLRTNEVMIPIE